MINAATKIFNRVYQSYITGGDTYTYYYKTDDRKEIDEITNAIGELSKNGLVDILYQSDKKARLCITHEGIAYGNDNY